MIAKNSTVRIKDNVEEVLTRLGFEDPEIFNSLIGTIQKVLDVWEEDNTWYATIDMCVEVPFECCEELI